jgi:hypothetical protein
MKPILTLIILAQLAFVSTALAVPNLINYQGKLTSSTGAELTGTYMMRFQLYPDLESGFHLWEETQSVQVNKGMYDVLLGGVEPLPPNIAAGGLYLQVSIRNSGGVLEILTPRQRLTSSPYALQAANAEKVGGKTPEEIVTGHTHDISEITGTIDAHTLQGFGPSAFATSGHSHDDRYYTQGQLDDSFNNVNQALSLKASVWHNHDNVYYTQAQVNDLIDPLIVQVANLQAAVNQLTTLLEGVSRVDNGKTIRFSDMNVQVVNGMGNTSTVNGLGNLIIGYDETNTSTNLLRCSNGAYSEQATCEQNGATWSHTHKSGSHYLVVGSQNNYSRYGGMVAGFRNFSTGDYATVSAGERNTAGGYNSSVSGGNLNTASGWNSSVSGGSGSTASGAHSSVSGGEWNTASGGNSSVSGGRSNTASDLWSSVSGGQSNAASGYYTSVSGGKSNTARHSHTSVSGGLSNTANMWYSSVSGGRENIASGYYSSVSGGRENIASAYYSSVSGGQRNAAEGWDSSVSGGYQRSVTGQYNWGAGSLIETR